MKKLREEIEEVLEKYNAKDMRIEVTDTHGKMFTSNWTTKVKSTLKKDLISLFKRYAKECVPEKKKRHWMNWDSMCVDGFNQCRDKILSNIDE